MKDVWELHVDECSTNKGKRFMVFAGILVRRADARQLEASVARWKGTLLDPPSEFAWSSTSVARLPTYRLFATGAMHHCKGGSLFFRSAIFDKRDIDYRKWHDGDNVLGYYKFLYKFLLKGFTPVIPNGDTVHVYLDERSTSYPLAQLKWRLNSGIAYHYWPERFRVCNVEPVASQNSIFVQTADVFGGAIAHWKNHAPLGSTSKRGAAKDELCEHIRRKACISWEGDTLNWTAPFRLWHFQLDKEKNALKPSRVNSPH